MIFACMNACAAEACRSDAVGVVSLTCSGQLPPAFIVSHDLADGVIVAGCADNSCLNRRGEAWTTDRADHRRDPRLRERIPSERVKLVWAGRRGAAHLQGEVEALAERLELLGPYRPLRDRKIAPSEPGRADA